MRAENGALLDQESALSCPGGRKFGGHVAVTRCHPRCFLALLLGVWPFLATAQNATPNMSNSAPLDLAAMALAPDDVPTAYFDDYSEWWVPAGPFSELVLGGAAVPPGLMRVYQSFYTEPNGAGA